MMTAIEAAIIAVVGVGVQWLRATYALPDNNDQRHASRRTKPGRP
jgi:hypothetical protein